MSDTALKNGHNEDMELLLPWYATGKLSDSEKRQVEAWLDGNRQAQRHLEIVREEMALTIESNESLGVASAGALHRLMNAVEAEGDARPQADPQQGSFMERIAGFFGGFSPRVYATALAACLMLLIAQAGIIGALLTSTPDTTFQTATGGGPASAESGIIALVAFQDAASASDIGALMNDNEAEIIGGPGEGGLYRVRFPQSADQDKVVDQLRAASDVVKFVALSQ
jgi:anti-sigma factor RsiW